MLLQAEACRWRVWRGVLTGRLSYLPFGARQVTEVVSRLIIDCFVQCRKREMEAGQSNAKKARTRR
jgi:hypothetical protein